LTIGVKEVQFYTNNQNNHCIECLETAEKYNQQENLEYWDILKYNIQLKVIFQDLWVCSCSKAYLGLCF
jgi:hypothetical protein